MNTSYDEKNFDRCYRLVGENKETIVVLLYTLFLFIRYNFFLVYLVYYTKCLLLSETCFTPSNTFYATDCPILCLLLYLFRLDIDIGQLAANSIVLLAYLCLSLCIAYIIIHLCNLLDNVLKIFGILPCQLSCILWS